MRRTDIDGTLLLELTHLHILKNHRMSEVVFCSSFQIECACARLWRHSASLDQLTRRFSSPTTRTGSWYCLLSTGRVVAMAYHTLAVSFKRSLEFQSACQVPAVYRVHSCFSARHLSIVMEGHLRQLARLSFKQSELHNKDPFSCFTLGTFKLSLT